MVVAGVFLVARLYPVFHTGLDINVAGQHFNLIAVIGGITIVIAAALAFVQNDIKKVLAYSTVSQLGYMMMGLGVGAWMPAVFHIFTHAFFKCCLFLCAGSVAHTGSHHSFDMKKDMGGLRKKMPITFGTLDRRHRSRCAACRSSAASSPRTRSSTPPTTTTTTVFWIIGLVGAFMTTAYMTRATYLTFFGKARGGAAHFVHGDDDHHAAHAAPRRTTTTARHACRTSRATTPSLAHGQLAAVRPRRLAGADHRAADHPRLPRRGRRLPQRRSRSHRQVRPSGSQSVDRRCERSRGGRDVRVGQRAAVASCSSPPASSSACALCKRVYGKARVAVQGSHRAQPRARRRPHVPGQQVLPRLSSTRRSSSTPSPTRSPQAAYWINQNVIDGIVNGVGIGGRQAPATGSTATSTSVSSTVRSTAVARSHAAPVARCNRCNQARSAMYGALLFGAAAVGALVLVIVNS